VLPLEIVPLDFQMELTLETSCMGRPLGSGFAPFGQDREDLACIRLASRPFTMMCCVDTEEVTASRRGESSTWGWLRRCGSEREQKVRSKRRPSGQRSVPMHEVFYPPSKSERDAFGGSAKGAIAESPIGEARCLIGSSRLSASASPG
jgi:hypothetical protein